MKKLPEGWVKDTGSDSMLYDTTPGCEVWYLQHGCKDRLELAIKRTDRRIQDGNSVMPGDWEVFKEVFAEWYETQSTK